MLRKPPEDPVKLQQPENRIKLPEESGIRSIAGFKEFLAMAESSKGSQIELSWTTKTVGQRFVIDMLWDANKKAPFWTLYEENNGKSKRLWDEPLNLANVDMCYDVLVMTCGGIDPPTKNLAEILKSQPEKMDWGKTSSKAGSSSAVASVEQVSDGAETNAGAETNVGDANSVASSVLPESIGQNVVPNNSFPPNTNQYPGFPPGYIFPPGMGVAINPSMGLPMPGYNTFSNTVMPPNAAMPPGTSMPPNAQMPVPIYPPNMNPPNVGFPLQQAMQPNAWQYASSGGGNFYGQANMANPAMQDLSMQSVSVTSLPAQGILSSLPVDAALLNKQNGISLVDLLVKAELITETTLAAALKMQELIETGTISWEKATEVLKHQHNKGQNIHNYISTSDSSSLSENKQNDNSAVFGLLAQAGIISKDDIQHARSVGKKHGGDIATILQAAQKLNEKTFEAAKICCSLQNEGLFKLEQSVIVLNYCSRGRVSFDEALSELQWPNPQQHTSQ